MHHSENFWTNIGDGIPFGMPHDLFQHHFEFITLILNHVNLLELGIL